MSTEYTTSNAIYSSGTFDTASNGTTTVTYQIGDSDYSTANDSCTVNWYDCWPHYYYRWCGCDYRTPKIETAFKIVQMLMDKKIAKITSVKKFVELVNEVSEVL